MSAITKYLKMNYEELDNEISKQNKKINSAKETISLLRKLQIADEAKSKKQHTPVPKYDENA